MTAVPAGRPGPADRILLSASPRIRIRAPAAGNPLQNAGHPEVVSRGTVVGMALAMFADQPGAKKIPNGGGSGKLHCAKLINGHYAASPASVSKPSGITARSSVLRGPVAINYYKK
jgi:hypothetical protein